MKIFGLCVLILLISQPLFAGGKSSEVQVVAEDDSDIKLMQEMKSRRSMLDWHRYTAWATVGLMAAAVATAPSEHGSVGDTHKTFGLLSAAGYLTSASLAYFAPRPEGTSQQENIIIHKKLAWIHAPAFALTAISGLIAQNQREDGKKTSGLGSAHPTFVAITAISFGAAAILSTDWSLNIIPTSKKDIACVLSKSF